MTGGVAYLTQRSRLASQRGIAVTSTSIINSSAARAGSEMPVVAGPGSVKQAERTLRLSFSSSAVPRS